MHDAAKLMPLTIADPLFFGAVFVGGMLGGMMRYWIAGLIPRSAGKDFPWGTLLVNVTGAFGIGVMMALFTTTHLAMHVMQTHTQFLWTILALGILGSYTTVSSFSLQTLGLLRSGKKLAALLNIFLSLFLCLGACALAYTVAVFTLALSTA